MTKLYKFYLRFFHPKAIAGNFIFGFCTRRADPPKGSGSYFLVPITWCFFIEKIYFALLRGISG
jgi:hypothetical protein